jgi:hypothetical protein
MQNFNSDNQNDQNRIRDQEEYPENDLQRFERNLKDARNLNMPKGDAESLLEVANTIVPPNIFEKFMTRNMGNKKRIENYKEAISRRVESHFDKSRKKKLADLLKTN